MKRIVLGALAAAAVVGALISCKGPGIPPTTPQEGTTLSPAVAEDFPSSFEEARFHSPSPLPCMARWTHDKLLDAASPAKLDAATAAKLDAAVVAKHDAIIAAIDASGGDTDAHATFRGSMERAKANLRSTTFRFTEDEQRAAIAVLIGDPELEAAFIAATEEFGAQVEALNCDIFL